VDISLDLGIKMSPFLDDLMRGAKL